MALWVRILDLPVKFFKDFTVAKIGKILGDVVKVDPLTIGQSRGKFARVCIEIDLSKPLRPVVEVQNIAYHVVYEGISMICFECGCFGHPKDKCPSIVTAKVDVSSHQDPSEVENVPNAQSEVEMHASEDIVKEDMGPWMLMTYRNKKKNGNSRRSKNLNASGSRFSVLQEEEINEKVPNVENDADMPSGDTPNIVKLWNNFQDKKKKTSKPKNNLSSTSNPKPPMVTSKFSPKPSKVLNVNSDVNVSDTSARQPMKDVSNVGSSGMTKTDLQYQRKAKFLNGSSSKQNSQVFKKLSFENVKQLRFRR